MIYKSIRHTIAAGLVCCGIAAALTACSDTWDEHYDATASDSGQGAMEGSLWQAIKRNGNLSNFASVVEACGYDKSLNSSQVFTVFAPTNENFSSAEAAELIETYNREKGKVNDEDNTVIKEFLQNHIALYNHSVSPTSNDSLVMMNGKYVRLTASEFGNTNILSSNLHYQNGVLFTVDKKATYFPNVFEYLRKDADLDSLSSFFYDNHFYRLRFVESQSVPGGFVDGKTVYLDSVFVQENELFNYNFLDAELNSEDSTYIMVAPTNEVWRNLIDQYTQYFFYDKSVTDRDSLNYTMPRLAIAQGTTFSRTNNSDAQLVDSAFSTSAVLYSSRNYIWGENFLHYYQFGDGNGSQHKPFGAGGVFDGAQRIVCSNGEVLKTNVWNINPLNTFYQWIRVEAESAGSIREVSKVENTSTHEMEDDVTPLPRVVNNDNHFYGMLGHNSFVEFEPNRTAVNHSVTFNIPGVLSNIGYDIYLVVAPALANDSNAVEAQRLPTKLRCTLDFHDSQGITRTETLQSSITTTPDIVDYLLLAEDFKFPSCTYGLNEDLTQVSLKVETRVSSTEQRNSKFTRTMMIDCVLLVPHGISTVDDDYFYLSPHGDGLVYMIPKK